MNLLNTLLIYLTMVFVSSVQMAPEPSPVPVTPTPSPTAIVTVAPSATATPTAVPTPAITPNNDYPTLEVGDKGDDVTLMQRRLAELGYYAGDIDGVFGNQTRRAVERFQYYQGLTVDGIAGKKTLTVLYESSDVVFAPVDVPTPTPTASPTAKPTAAVTTPPATQTPAPTFVPTATPSPTPSPTPTPTATPTATATVAPRASVATAAAAETASAGPSVSPEATATPESTGTAAEITGIPAVTDAADTTEPAETPVAAPAPTVNDTQVFVLAGSEEPMTLFGDTEPSGAEADVLHPAQLAETVYVPLLEILKNAGVEIVPESYDQQRIVSFTLADGVYTLSYTQQDESAVTDVTVTVNDEAWALTLDTGFVLEGVLYLPLDTATEATGATFMLNEATGVYTVALPETAAETTPAAQAITTPTLDATRTFLLEGSDQPLTVDPADAQSETLRPLLYGDTVYAPVLPILKNLGSIVLPNAVEGSREAAFSLGSDLFQLSCTVDETGAISGLTVLKNQEPQIIADRTGWEADGILYLPLASVTEATGVTFTPNEDGTAYVAALPAGAVIAE